jgi:uncharacterized protein DUF1905
MISVTGPLWLWTGENGSWHFVTVSKDLCDEIRAQAMAELRGFRSVRIEATVNGVRWRTSVFPVKSGDYFLPIKAEVRRKAGIAAGDEVEVTLELL